ncbi:MAG: agmatine deiminase family protein [Gammaproteobacteria bacterium]
MTSYYQNRLPAEWEAQQAVMLTWPHGHGDWAPWLAQVEPVFVEIAHQIALRQGLIISCYDAAHERHIRTLLAQKGINSAALATYIVPSNDSWVRDHGPITVLRSGVPQLLDFTFNGWGGKFDSSLDDRITRALHAQGAFGNTPLEPIDLVLEGGSIEVDGAGTLLTTTQCLLSPQRNPQLDRRQIELKLRELFGIKRVLWLEHGHLAGDDTDSHIDTLARFCNSSTIAYVACDDPDDEHYADLQAMQTELQGFRTAQGNPYQLVPLPWPQAKYDATGQRLPASYANFLITNGAVLAPTYADPSDAAALACLQRCFPQHQIIGVPCLPLIMQYGSLHCVTMQLPANQPGVHVRP